MSEVLKRKPTSAGRRFVVDVVDKSLHKGSPEKSLTRKKIRCGGRNSKGHITVRHRGGGHKKKYRIVDFKRYDKEGISAKVERLEYDPNRTANLALLAYADGEKRYILAPKNLKIGDKIQSGSNADIKVGNAMPLRNIPVGTQIHAIELRPGKGAQIARSAGAVTQLIAVEGQYAIVRLASKEMRKILADCYATIGEVGNSEHNLRKIGKAGANRWRGKRPTVRGVAMNPVDHPHGGGEGRSSGGRHPTTPWGMPTKGYKTRKSKKSNKLIVRKRGQSKK